MKGLVLCGGKSLRMGRDKGMIETQGKPWALQIAGELQSLGLEVLFSVNELQQSSYLKFMDNESLLVDNPSLKIEGPLIGIMSAHLLYPNEDFLVLACDMQQLTAKVLTILLSQAGLHSEKQAVYFQDEPLCALYNSSGLKQISISMDNGTLPGYSLKKILQQIDSKAIAIDKKISSAFKNYNYPADI